MNYKTLVAMMILGMTAAVPLQIANAQISSRLTAVKKVLVMGNSLTKHGPSTAALGWKHNFGMAATSLEKDYVHQLFEKISRVQQPEGRKPELKVVTMLATNIHTPQEVIDYAADYIVLQMGDNLAAEKATEESLVKPYVQLVQKLKGANPQASVFITSLWGGTSPGDERNKLIEQVCNSVGATFVDLRPIAADPQNRASSEGVYKHPGVAWHPGDRGMQRIAEAIWEKTQKKYLQESGLATTAVPAAQINGKPTVKVAAGVADRAALLQVRQPFLIPKPQRIRWSEQSIPVHRNIWVHNTTANSQAAEALKRHLEAIGGYTISVSDKPAGDKTSCTQIQLREVERVPEATANLTESYAIEIAANGIVLSAPSNAGLFYATQTLNQLFEQFANERYLPLGTISDWPSLRHRGAFLTLRSVKATPEAMVRLKDLVTAMAAFKINYLMLELGENMQYERQVFPTNTATAFSKAQVKELVNHAKTLHMEVVPYLQAVSHVQWMTGNPDNLRLTADPKLGRSWDNAWLLDSPDVRAFFKDIVDETIEVFEPTEFNMSFDELNHGPFKAHPGSKITDPADLFYKEVMMVYDLLAAHKVKMLVAQDTFLPFPNAYAVQDKAQGWKVLDRLPKDVKIWLWYYGTSQEALDKEVGWFAQRNFRIMGATFGAQNNRLMARTFASRTDTDGMMQTYWYLAGDWSNYEAQAPHGIAMTLSLAEFAWNAQADNNPNYDTVHKFMSKWRSPLAPATRYATRPVNLKPYFNSIVGAKNSPWPRLNDALSFDFQTHSLTVEKDEFSIVGKEQPNAVVISGRPGDGLPATAPPIIINQAARELVFVHAAGIPARYQELDSSAGRRQTPLLGQYVIRYSDGTEATFPLRYRLEIMDWNGIVSPIYGRTVLQGKADGGERYQFTAVRWTNPHPGKSIDSVRMEATGQDEASLALLALSIAPTSTLKTIPLSQAPADNWKMHAQGFAGNAILSPGAGSDLRINIPAPSSGAVGRIDFTRPISVPKGEAYSLQFKLRVGHAPRSFGIFFMDPVSKGTRVHFIYPKPGEQIVRVDPAKGRPEGNITIDQVSQLQLSFWILAGTPAQQIEISDVEWTSEPMVRPVNTMESWWESN